MRRAKGRPRSPAGTYSCWRLMFFSKICAGSSVMRLPSKKLVSPWQHGRACAAPQRTGAHAPGTVSTRRCLGCPRGAQACARSSSRMSGAAPTGCTHAARRGNPAAHAHGLAGGCGPQPGSLEREEGYSKATLHQRAHVQFCELDVVGKCLRGELREEVAIQPPGFVVAARQKVRRATTQVHTGRVLG